MTWGSDRASGYREEKKIWVESLEPAVGAHKIKKINRVPFRHSMLTRKKPFVYYSNIDEY